MEKEPLKSVQISTGTRVYYFDVHKDNTDKFYLVISEIPTDSSPGNKKRRKVFVHSKNIDRFADAMKQIVNFMQEGEDHV